MPGILELFSIRERVDFFATADCFAIDELVSESAEQFAQQLDCMQHKVKFEEPLLSEEELEEFFYAARLA